VFSKRPKTFLGIDTVLDDGYTLLCLDGDDTINVTASCEVIMSMYPWCLTTSALLQAFDNAGEVRVVLKGKLLFTVPMHCSNPLLFSCSILILRLT